MEWGKNIKKKSAVARQRDDLNTMVELVRGKLTKLQRLTIGALIVLDVNNLQSTENMEKKKIDSIHDFDWIKQMRFYRKKLNTNLFFFNVYLFIYFI